jgi:hypothetical protein
MSWHGQGLTRLGTGLVWMARPLSGRCCPKVANAIQHLRPDGEYGHLIPRFPHARRGLPRALCQQKTPNSFEFQEVGGGKSNVAFDYRIAALRKGHEAVRLADVPSSSAFRGLCAPPTRADVLAIENTVVIPSSFPETAGILDRAGWRVLPIEVSELQKVEAGVTCMSLILTVSEGV